MTQLLQHREGLGALAHGQFLEGITGARGRRRTQDLDLLGRQGRVHVLPGLVGVVDQLAVRAGDLARQGQEQVAPGQLELRRGLGISHYDAVIAYLDLGDAGYAVTG